MKYKQPFKFIHKLEEGLCGGSVQDGSPYVSDVSFISKGSQISGPLDEGLVHIQDVNPRI